MSVADRDANENVAYWIFPSALAVYFQANCPPVSIILVYPIVYFSGATWG
jgi:hypothetical protein